MKCELLVIVDECSVRGIKRDELSKQGAAEISGEAPHAFAPEEPIGVAIGEGRDHSK
ncbi:MAG: hypothetical protein ACR2HZ_09715 [Gemmatimonadaceae bacterium]